MVGIDGGKVGGAEERKEGATVARKVAARRARLGA
jgi:hypothetical protein